MSEAQSVLIADADTPGGRAIASRFAGTGARLALCGANEAALERLAAELGGPGSSLLTIRADRRSLAQVEPAVEQVIGAFGAIDALVTCPQPLAPAPIEELEEEQWRDAVDGFLKAAFGFAKFASKRMVERRSGRIVNVGAGEVLGRVRYTHGAAAAAGLLSLTRTLALELARFSVTVNAVIPGVIAWDGSDPGKVSDRTDTVPARRPGNPLEVADAVHFLASEKAAYITGQALYVDGGRDLLPALVLEPPEA